MYGTTNLQFCGVFTYIDLVLHIWHLYTQVGPKPTVSLCMQNLCCHTEQLIHSPVSYLVRKVHSPLAFMLISFVLLGAQASLLSMDKCCTCAHISQQHFWRRLFLVVKVNLHWVIQWKLFGEEQMSSEFVLSQTVDHWLRFSEMWYVCIFYCITCLLTRIPFKKVMYFYLQM